MFKGNNKDTGTTPDYPGDMYLFKVAIETLENGVKYV